MNGLPDPPPEPPVNRSLECLAPLFKIKVVSMLADMEVRGFDPVVSETCRSNERQEWLYGIGREYDDGRADGAPVTDAPTGFHGWHMFGLAVDVTSKRDEWKAPKRFWDALGSAALRHQLSWGGLWRRPDLPHVQWSNMRQSPSSNAQTLWAEGGNEAVWREVQAI